MNVMTRHSIYVLRCLVAHDLIKQSLNDADI